MKEKNVMVNTSIVFMIIAILMRILFELYTKKIINMDFSLASINSYIASACSFVFSIISIAVEKNKKAKIKSIIMISINSVVLFINLYIFFSRLMGGLQALGKIG